jgi:hypothetical protein
VRDNGFRGLAGRAIVYAQIETRFVRFDTGQYQRPAAFGAGRPMIIDELKFERVHHRGGLNLFVCLSSPDRVPHGNDHDRAGGDPDER